MSASTDDNRLVTVCEACLTATCWHNIFPCEDFITAGLKKLPIRELRALNREHERYWSKEHLEKYGDYNA